MEKLSLLMNRWCSQITTLIVSAPQTPPAYHSHSSLVRSRFNFRSTTSNLQPHGCCLPSELPPNQHQPRGLHRYVDFTSVDKTAPKTAASMSTSYTVLPKKSIYLHTLTISGDRKRKSILFSR